MTAELTPITTSFALTVGTDTYVTAAEADTYMAGRLYADAWTDASTADRTRALVSACRNLARLTYKRRKTDPTQALDFPRTSASYPYTDDWQYIQTVYDDTIVPQVVKDAQCDEAFALLDVGDSERSNLQAQGVTQITLGRLTEVYGSSRTGGLVSRDAYTRLLPWIAGAVRIARFR